MKVKRKIIQIDEDLCDGCGNCIISCAEGALALVDGKAKVVADKYCDGLGACLGECPTGALEIVERDADDFDEEAVHDHLDRLKASQSSAERPIPCGCPSAHLQSFKAARAPAKPGGAVPEEPPLCALSHWPVQIRLVPPTAPFLKNADLLVAADCTPFAYPAFHRDFLEGKVLMVGCPKFDDAAAYVEKFAGIFAHASVRSVTVVVMEVPCCQGLPAIVKRAMQMAGKTVPTEQIVVSVRGQILSRDKLVA